MRRSDDCRHPRPTEAVHGLARDRYRQPCQQDRHPTDIPVVLAGLVGGADDHVVDGRWVDAGPLDNGLDHVRSEVIRASIRECPAISAEGRPQPVHHDRDAARISVARHLDSMPPCVLPDRMGGIASAPW
jgi:hypothetical protein